MTKLVLLRHGESLWNRDNLFTGWTDVDLSERGIQEAHAAAETMLAAGLHFDISFTSYLKRAIRTLWIILDRMDLMWIPVLRSWRLNERHYGLLQGLNKEETARAEGHERVHAWRRSYEGSPDPISPTDPRHPLHDPRYADIPPAELPSAESLKAALQRVLPYWHREIVPHIRSGRRAIIVAHGNSLRALVKYLDSIPDNQIPKVVIPTGIPLVYEFGSDLQVLSHYYIGGPEGKASP